MTQRLAARPPLVAEAAGSRPEHGSTDELLRRSGRTYAASGRAVVGVLVGLIAPFAGPPAGIVVCAAVSVCFIAWSLYYGWRMHRAPRTWVWVVDVGVLSAIGLAQPLLVDPRLTLQMAGWVSPVASFAVVALQWHLRPLSAAAATAVVTVALAVGGALSPEIDIWQALGSGGLWTPMEAVLSQVLWRLVRRGGRIADKVMEEGFAHEREAALAAARRADQRLHWATVHDTAASTLLMVGLGEVRGDESWLPEQVHRDIAALRGDPPETAGPHELRATLAAVADRAGVDVRLDLPVDDQHGVRVPAVVGTAIEGAVGEALENVRRHAGAESALVCLRTEAGGRVVVTVADDGCGFAPADVPSSRHGLVLSIRERLARAGGRASIVSAPGAGTRVELEWPR